MGEANYRRFATAGDLTGRRIPTAALADWLAAEEELETARREVGWE